MSKPPKGESFAPAARRGALPVDDEAKPAGERFVHTAARRTPVGPQAPADQEEPESGMEVLLGPRWKNRLPLAILTLAPTVYLAAKFYLRTHSVGLALGVGVICPFSVYFVFDAWLDDSRWFMRSSWSRWCAHHSEKRPLLGAVIGALVFIGFFALLWFAESAVTRS